MTLFPPEIIENSTEAHFARSSTKSKSIYLVVLITIIASFIVLPFIYIDITTQAQGIIRTPNENNTLQTVVYGEVEKIFIKENTMVQEGDTLIILNSDKIHEQIHRYHNKYSENKDFIKDLSTIIKSQKLTLITPKYRAEFSLYKATLSEGNTNIEYLKTEYDLHKDLHQKGVTPQQEYLQYKSRYDNAVTQFENKKKQFSLNWETERSRLEIENREISSSIRQLNEEKNIYIIKAPSTGSIIQFSGIKKGCFIAPSQTIATITSNDSLIIECYVSPLDIGYIIETQKVIFQLTAFDYNQWGLAHGEVIEISDDIITINDQSIFLVRCSIDQPYLELKNGYKGKLKKGMTLTGRFYLTERTLWQLLFDKVDDWVNPKIIG